MGEWREYKVGDILTLEYGKSLKGYRDYIGKYDVFGTNGKIGKTDKFLYSTPSIIIGRKGAYREVYFAKNPFFVIDTAFYTKNKLQNIDNLFMYYWFKNIDINSMDSGSAIPSTSRDEVYDLDISLPPLKEQKAIAEVLSSLDDKIDLLHCQNKTLEALAQTIFREWFIEGADEGWEEYEIRDFATHKKVSIKPAQNPTSKFLHFSLPAFDKNKEPSIELGSDIKSNKYRVEPYSILMSKLNPKTPRVWDIYFKPEDNSICSTEFQVVQPDDKDFIPFISTLLKSDKVRNDLAMSASGTSGSHQRVKPEDIFSIGFLTPSVDKIKEFSKILEQNYLKQRKNQQQIKTLENLRDTLLPKLMSGEVRVKI